jgi:hypothetical protein
MKSVFSKFSDDWTVLRYGWLAVFIIHIGYLIAGNQALKGALAVSSPLLNTPPEVRITFALTSAKMIIVGFSAVLLMITVFIYEIFKMVRAMKLELAQIHHGMQYADSVPVGLDSSVDLSNEPDLFSDDD